MWQLNAASHLHTLIMMSF
uniref:Uncharacterized protein n=1 Tax=Anguilla anguilla TaxID=7936 RepID=A0A0E9U3J0_ANGAN